MSVPDLIDDDTLASVLGAALRTGGDFAEVFAEDKRIVVRRASTTARSRS